PAAAGLVRPVVSIFLLDVETHRAAAEDGKLVDSTLDRDARALRGRAAISRQDRDLARAVVNLVELERDQRDAPAAGHDPRDPNALVVVLGRLVFQLGDFHAARGAAGNQKRAQEYDRQS